jgi:solute carrier family 35 protein E3
MGDKAPARASLSGVVLLGVNIASAVLVIFLSKQLFVAQSFRWPLALGASNLVATFLAARAMRLWLSSPTVEGSVERAPMSRLVQVAALNVVSLCCLSLSLQSNSLGVYQIAKMLTVPGTALLSWLMQGRRYSYWVLASLMVMTFGVGLTVQTLAVRDMLGPALALGGVLSVCFGTVLMGNLQSKHGSNPTALLESTLPIQFGLLLAPLAVEQVYVGSIFSAGVWQPTTTGCVLASALVAIFLNFSGQAMLGVFSSVTYAVVGYLKTAFVLVIGILVFGDVFTGTVLVGLAFVFGGSVAYTIFNAVDRQ